MDRTPPAAPIPSVEWPTIAVAAGCYGGWLGLTLAWGSLPGWLLTPLIALSLTLHSSLQHEILHGHPTRLPWLNRLLGDIPLSLWIPFVRFRDTHLAHHVNARLTDPLEDPETNYWTREDWEALHPLARAIVRIEATLAGRVTVGPWWRIARFLRAEAGAFRRDEPGIRRAWIAHGLLCVPVLAWVQLACGIPIWLYVAAMVVPGNGVLLIRSYAEHRAREAVPERTAIVEGSRLLGPLFLYNNLHALHHDEPALPWYQYPARYRQRRAELLERNGGLVYAGYADLARRYLFRAQDVLVHPMGRAVTKP